MGCNRNTAADTGTRVQLMLESRRHLYFCWLRAETRNRGARRHDPREAKAASLAVSSACSRSRYDHDRDEPRSRGPRRFRDAPSEACRADGRRLFDRLWHP